MQKPRLSFAQIWNMSFGFFGIQFAFALQQANMSGIYKTLHADTDRIPFLWLAAPLTGLIVQPIIGSMSDRTWNRLGRRRPYFLFGALLSACALYFMPDSSAIWMAVLFLWVLDASVNISMEPFRAFVADKLNPEQRTTGFVMQSFFIGAGAAIGSALPWLFRQFGVIGETNSGIALTVKYSFQLGAAALLVAVLWTVFMSKEYPPENMEEFRRVKAEGAGIGNWFREIFLAVREVPATMKQLAIVQLFTWLGLFCMWLFFGLATAQQVFKAVDPDSVAFKEGIEWGGFAFAIYNVVCFIVAFLLPRIAAVSSRKTVHALSLVCGGLGLLSAYFIVDKHLWLITMVGVGIAWASILSMPYAILSGALPPARIGVYMGIFNLFIVIPEIVASLTFQPLVKHIFNNNPLYVVMLGGGALLVAAALVAIVEDVSDRAPLETIIKGDERELLSPSMTAQPVPSSGLIDKQ